MIPMQGYYPHRNAVVHWIVKSRSFVTLRLGIPRSKSHQEVPIMRQPNAIEWYCILRAHYHLTMFQSIRYALWLVR
jgi:hypothetical protein